MRKAPAPAGAFRVFGDSSSVRGMLLGVDVGGTFTDAVVFDGRPCTPPRRRPRRTTSRAACWPRSTRHWSVPARVATGSRPSPMG